MTDNLERAKIFLADLARPFSIYAASVSGAWATIVIAGKVTTAEGGALVLGVLAGWGTALYAGKAIENTRLSGHAADVEKARVSATPPAGTAVITAAPDVDVTVRDAAGGDAEPDPTMYGGPRQ